MHHRHPFIPRSRLVAFDPTLLVRLFNDAVGIEPVARQLAFPVDIDATPTAYTVKVDVPGIAKNQIHIEAVDQHLTLTIDKGTPNAEEDQTLCHQERWRVHGRRQFKLPEDAQVDRISAALVHGVLTISLPRHQPEAPKVHTVTISEDPMDHEAVKSSPTAE